LTGTDLGGGGCRRLLGCVADEPTPVLVLQGHVVAAHVEGERADAGPAARLESACQGPASVLATEGVPLDGLGVDVLAAQLVGHRVPQRTAPAQGAGPFGGAAAYGGELCALGDVRALGEHGSGVRHDLLHAGPGSVGDGLCRLSGADACLDVAGAKGAVHTCLQVAWAGLLTTEGGA